MSKQGYYAVLGISKSASDDEIKTSYRKLASKYHPDKVTGDEEKKVAEEKFKEIKEAYEILSNLDKRRHYDMHGHASMDQFSHNHGNPNTHWNFSGNVNEFNEIFGNIFKGHPGFEEGIFNQTRQQVTNLISISLIDAYLGKSIKIDSSTVINVPKGMRSGTKFFVNNKMYRVDIQPHAKFKRSNDDLLVDIEINAIEASLGLPAILDHLDGAMLQFTIPAGIQPGQVIKLSGKGMKNPETDRHGDMLVRISILIPRNLTEEEKIVLSKLSHRETINI